MKLAGAHATSPVIVCLSLSLSDPIANFIVAQQLLMPGPVSFSFYDRSVIIFAALFFLPEINLL